MLDKCFIPQRYLFSYLGSSLSSLTLSASNMVYIHERWELHGFVGSGLEIQNS